MIEILYYHLFFIIFINELWQSTTGKIRIKCYLKYISQINLLIYPDFDNSAKYLKSEKMIDPGNQDREILT